MPTKLTSLIVSLANSHNSLALIRKLMKQAHNNKRITRPEKHRHKLHRSIKKKSHPILRYDCVRGSCVFGQMSELVFHKDGCANIDNSTKL